MTRIGEVWQLRRGDDLVGEVTITDSDFPWLYGRLAPRAGFVAVAPLFAEELGLMQVLMVSPE